MVMHSDSFLIFCWFLLFLAEGAITVPIMDTGRTAIARGDEVNVVAANRQSFFQLRNTQSLLEKDLTVRVTCINAFFTKFLSMQLLIASSSCWHS